MNCSLYKTTQFTRAAEWTDVRKWKQSGFYFLLNVRQRVRRAYH